MRKNHIAFFIFSIFFHVTCGIQSNNLVDLLTKSTKYDQHLSIVRSLVRLELSNFQFLMRFAAKTTILLPLNKVWLAYPHWVYYAITDKFVRRRLMQLGLLMESSLPANRNETIPNNVQLHRALNMMYGIYPKGLDNNSSSIMCAVEERVPEWKLGRCANLYGPIFFQQITVYFVDRFLVTKEVELDIERKITIARSQIKLQSVILPIQELNENADKT